jgi:hypothetical protein
MVVFLPDALLSGAPLRFSIGASFSIGTPYETDIFELFH